MFYEWGQPSCQYRLFISHAWEYNDDYEGVKKLLNGDASFGWENLSVPFDEPLALSPSFPRSYGTIVDQLREKIMQADCLVVIAAMYCSYRGWIQTEIEAAKQFGKPIVAVRPCGQERLPAVIREADEQVGWRTASIVGAIQRLATPGVGGHSTRTIGNLMGELGWLAPSSSAPPPAVRPLARPSQLAGLPTAGRYRPGASLKNLAASEPANVFQNALGLTPSRPGDRLKSAFDHFSRYGPPKE